ncbi:MAG TPA: F0F1 ATP synthase subunit A [Candidatus Baltobacteraceae bacterium]|nr:F0F1 ATP synthase subunit A [Candidatus Baltobacteraceae bacterium]
MSALAYVAVAPTEKNWGRGISTNRMQYCFSSRLSLALFAVCCSCIFATSATGTEPPPLPETAEHVAVPLKPAPLVKIGKFAVTNSMLVTWIVAAGIIVFAQIATRRIQPIPSGIQNFWEWLVESLYNFLENIIGRDLVGKTFWFFATLFIFILFVNWFGLIPGVGTIGWGHHDPITGVFHVDRPLLRGGNADLNMTTAMAAIFFVLWFIWAIQAQGVGGFLKHLFAPKGETSGILKILMVFIFFAVGWLEVISILFRPIALSFRLFGNIYAGESILEALSSMIPALGWLIPIPFYFLEVLVGFVQALVFMLLTAVFTLLIAQHGPGPEREHA